MELGDKALWDSRDQWHKAAVAAYSQLKSTPYRPITTSSILLECGNAAARREYRRDVLETRSIMLQLDGLIEPTKEDVADAWQEYQKGQPGSAGIVDCISFVVMRCLGIEVVFTNDQHFADAGFKILF